MSKTIDRIIEITFLLLILASHAHAVGIAACGALAGSTEYYLTANIGGIATRCFYFTGNNSVFDCNGYQLDGTGVAASIAFQNNFTNNVIRNCSTLNQFYNVVTVHYMWANGSQNLTLQNLNISGATGAAINLESARQVYLYNVSIDNSGTFGINVEEASYNNTLAYCNGCNVSVAIIGGRVYGTSVNSSLVLNDSRMNFSTFPMASPLGDMNITNANTTPAILVKAFNESIGPVLDTIGTRITFNYSVGTFMSGANTNYWHVNDSSRVFPTAGIYRVYVSNASGYITEFEDVVVQSGGGAYIYLGLASSGNPYNNYVQFQTYTGEGNILSNTSIAIYRNYGGVWTFVRRRYTDGAGTASMYMDSSAQYMITASHYGYSDYTAFITPTSTDPYKIYLGTNASIGFQFPFADVSCRMTPHESYINNETTNFTVSVTSPTGALEWWAYWAWNGTALINASNPTWNDSTHPYGGVENFTVVNPYDVTYITVLAVFKHQNFSGTYNCTQYWRVWYHNVSNASLMSAVNLMRANQTQYGQVFTFIAFIIAYLVASLIGRFSPLAGVMAYILVLAVFTGIGFISGMFMFALALVAVAVGVIYVGR